MKTLVTNATIRLITLAATAALLAALVGHGSWQ